MGQPKPMLPFGGEPMLLRVARVVQEVVEPVVVVAGVRQPLPPLPASLILARDRCEDRGPLEGLAVGLATLGHEVDAAFVTSCDVPLLLPAFVRRIVELAQGYDAAAPYLEGFYEPLAAVYRACLLPRVEVLLAAGRLRPVYLLEAARTRRVLAHELTDVDPHLQSLQNVNTPAAYQAALRHAGG